MKLTITREQLQEGLTAVAAAVPTKTTLPVLSNVLVETVITSYSIHYTKLYEGFVSQGRGAATRD